MEAKIKNTSSNQEPGLIKKFFKISLFGIPMPLFLVGAVIIILGIQTKSYLRIWLEAYF